MQVVTNDPELDKYTNRINNLKQEIRMYQNIIREKEQDIRELKSLLKRLTTVNDALNRGRKDSTGIIGNILQGYIGGLIFKPKVFTPLKNIIDGNEFKRANNSANGSIEKVKRKIRELEKEIEDCRFKITAKQSLVMSTEMAKARYIQSKTMIM